MDYFKHYDKLLNKARYRGIKKKELNFYTERHRGMPKCIGGQYWNHNIFLLTPEEHYVAHQLLAKMFPEDSGMTFSAYKMTIHSSDNRSGNKLYGWIQRKHSYFAKQRTGSSNGSYGKSWYHDPETLENGKFLPKDVPEGWVKGRIINKDKKKNFTYCQYCNEITYSTIAKYCKQCRSKIRSENISNRNNKLIDDLEKISKRYTIIQKNIKNNEKFIKECINNGIPKRLILIKLGCNDSGGNYRTLAEVA